MNTDAAAAHPQPIDVSRRAAWRVLNDYSRRHSSVTILLSSCLGTPAPALNKGFTRELVWGVIRHLNTIDWLIDSHTRPGTAIEPGVRALLRLGIAQLFFLDGRVPAYAAVSGTVDLARAVGKARAATLINAVLRAALRSGGKLPAGDTVADRAVRLAHPAWMLSRWSERLGADAADELCRINNAAPPFTIRAVRTGRDELLEQLRLEGITGAACRYSNDGIILEGRPELENLEAYRNGSFVVQDEASQLAVRLLDPQPDEKIIDICSGAGIKAAHIWQLTGGRAVISCIDTEERQLERAAENFRRLGITGIVTRRTDARTLAGAEADRVLVDAPCSGLGVIRRKPDIKWNRLPEEITAKYPDLQKELLASAAALVRPGGAIVYCTCTTEPEENEGVVNAVMTQRGDLEIVPPNLAPELIADVKYFKTLPRMNGMDGFFACRLRRKG